MTARPAEFCDCTTRIGHTRTSPPYCVECGLPVRLSAARPEDTVRGERIRLAIQRTEVAEGDSWREDAVRELDALLAELAACREELRLREESQIPMIPRAAAERLERAEHERGEILDRWHDEMELRHDQVAATEALLADARQALQRIAALKPSGAYAADQVRNAASHAASALARLDAGERE